MKILDLLSESILTERVVNLFNPADKAKYAGPVWDILQASYKEAGGFHSASSPEELIQKSGLWKMIVRDGEVTAIGIYKDQDGRKSIASGTNGTRQGSKDYRMLKNEDVKFKRAWAEVSGKPEAMMVKSGLTPLSNKFAAVLTGKEILELNPDGVHYTRLINGNPYEKVIYGSVKMSPETLQKLEAAGVSMNELPSGAASATIQAEDVTQPELDQVEKFADALWGKLGIDVAFTRHFMDRLNDARNGKPITAAELIRIFKKEYERNGKNIANMDNSEAVMKDLLTNINLPFILKDTPRGKELVAKTVMRKNNFHTPDPSYVVNSKY